MASTTATRANARMRAAYGAGQMWAGLILATAAALLAPQWRVRVSAEAGVAARAPACPQAPAQAPSQAMLHAGFGPWPLRLRGGADSEEDLFADNGEEDEAAAAAIKAKAAAAQEKAKVSEASELRAPLLHLHQQKAQHVWHACACVPCVCLCLCVCVYVCMCVCVCVCVCV